MNAPESPTARRARLFSELCELDEAGRREALLLVAAEDAALAADVGRMLAFDRESRGPIEGLRGEVARAAERQLLADEIPEPAPPERLGAWRLGEKLGAGGMGEVWAAERVEGGFTQRAAVKLVRSGMASREIVARFAVERQLLARLEHPAIATLLDGGISPDGRPWFAMERVDGLPITHFADSHGLDLEARLRLLLAVADAVEFAHRSLVIHRDLKPSNILVTPSGAPKLLDFGLAKLLEPGFEAGIDPNVTRTEFRALTPAYAAPEQILGEPVTTAIDVYSLGVILYELLTGELPHRRRVSSATTLAADVAHETLERPSSRLRRLESGKAHGALRSRSIAPDLDTIVAKVLARERERRYPSVAAFAADLVAYLERRPIAARPDTVRYRLSRFIGRHRWGVASAALIAVSLVGGLAVATIQGRLARREANRAERVQEFLVRLFEGSDPAHTRGEAISARQLLEEGTRRIEAELADQPEVQVSLYNTLARIHRKLGALDESARLAASAIALSEGPHADPKAAALAHLALAETLSARFDFAGSRREVEAVLARLVADHGADSEPVARAKEELAGSLPQTGGTLEESYRLAQEAHAYYQKRYGDEHPETARRLALVAITLRQLDRLAEAEAAFARATATLERSLGADHPETAEVRRYWAAALDQAGRPDEAVAKMEQAVAALEKSLGPTHPTVARGQGDLAAVYSRHGRQAEAEPLLRRCAATLRGGGSREEGNCLRMLGQLLIDAPGRAAEAEATLENAVAILARGNALDPFLLNTLATLGRAKVLLGKLDAGEAMLRDALGRTEKVYGPVGDQLRRPLFWLGDLELARGRPVEAVAILRRALAISEKSRGATSTAVAKAAETLARALLVVGGDESFAEAVRLADRAAAIYRDAKVTPERLASMAELAKVIERASARRGLRLQQEGGGS